MSVRLYQAVIKKSFFFLIFCTKYMLIDLFSWSLGQKLTNFEQKSDKYLFFNEFCWVFKNLENCSHSPENHLIIPNIGFLEFSIVFHKLLKYCCFFKLESINKSFLRKLRKRVSKKCQRGCYLIYTVKPLHFALLYFAKPCTLHIQNLIVLHFAKIRFLQSTRF